MISCFWPNERSMDVIPKASQFSPPSFLEKGRSSPPGALKWRQPPLQPAVPSSSAESCCRERGSRPFLFGGKTGTPGYPKPAELAASATLRTALQVWFQMPSLQKVFWVKCQAVNRTGCHHTQGVMPWRAGLVVFRRASEMNISGHLTCMPWLLLFIYIIINKYIIIYLLF